MSKRGSHYGNHKQEEADEDVDIDELLSDCGDDDDDDEDGNNQKYVGEQSQRGSNYLSNAISYSQYTQAHHYQEQDHRENIGSKDDNDTEMNDDDSTENVMDSTSTTNRDETFGTHSQEGSSSDTSSQQQQSQHHQQVFRINQQQHYTNNQHFNNGYNQDLGNDNVQQQQFQQLIPTYPGVNGVPSGRLSFFRKKKKKNPYDEASIATLNPEWFINFTHFPLEVQGMEEALEKYNELGLGCRIQFKRGNCRKDLNGFTLQFTIRCFRGAGGKQKINQVGSRQNGLSEIQDDKNASQSSH
ncbi:UNKNOWN [Stylonychia lemnae]|uniref:Uncharacterized protein n=1 Tax=Stylonychia lemnae TaxID=5949 RepID=A0A078B3Z0_STYLE|nr:UNKNOWN [Stylonychia lemnae]|eukprot:CDW87902.1 UNKNOWN [Stylonychia lemnae]